MSGSSRQGSEGGNQRSRQIRETYAQIYRDLGDRYLAADEARMAIRHFDQSLRFDPDQAESYVGRAVGRLKIGTWEEALTDLNVAVRLAPDCTEALRLRGLIHFKQIEFDSAISDLTCAIRLEPSCAALFSMRGAAYFASGDLGKAIADFTAALHFEPDNVDMLCYRATARVQVGDFSGAIDDADKALTLAPSDPAAARMRDVACLAMSKKRAEATPDRRHIVQPQTCQPQPHASPCDGDASRSDFESEGVAARHGRGE